MKTRKRGREGERDGEGGREKVSRYPLCIMGENPRGFPRGFPLYSQALDVLTLSGIVVMTLCS